MRTLCPKCGHEYVGASCPLCTLHFGDAGVVVDDRLRSDEWFFVRRDGRVTEYHTHGLTWDDARPRLDVDDADNADTLAGKPRRGRTTPMTLREMWAEQAGMEPPVMSFDDMKITPSGIRPGDDNDNEEMLSTRDEVEDAARDLLIMNGHLHDVCGEKCSPYDGAVGEQRSAHVRAANILRAHARLIEDEIHVVRVGLDYRASRRWQEPMKSSLRRLQVTLSDVKDTIALLEKMGRG